MIDYIINKINKINNTLLRIYLSGLFFIILLIGALFSVIIIIISFITLTIFIVECNNVLIKTIFLLLLLSIIFFIVGCIIDCEKEIKKEKYQLKKD